MLKDSEEETRIFLERVDLLGAKLGVLLLQFPPMFRDQHFPLLKDYLRMLPSEHHYAVEVRNKSLLKEELYSLLKEHNVALAWIDAAKMPLTAKMTADFIYVRWEGDRKTVTGTLGKTETDRTQQIETWAEKIEHLSENGTPVFGYFSKYYSGFPTKDATELLKHVTKSH
jgi:uncharacterized protein YecE (DUF72 family)